VKGANDFIITHGTNPVYYFSSGKLFDKETGELPVCTWVADELKRDPTSQGDTTGCGDNFAGAAIASVARQLISGKEILSLKDVVTWGISSSGFACYWSAK